MRSLLVLVALAVPRLALAQQQLDPNEALNRALEATAELISITKKTDDPATTASAQKASVALSLAVQSMRTQPLCVLPMVIDSVSFNLFIEELQRGNRTNTLPMPFITRSLQRHYFSVSQLKTLVELVSRASDRLQLVQLASRRLVDPEAAGALYDLFPATSDKRALAMILAG